MRAPQIRLPADLAGLIARDVLDALDYAHNAVDANGRALGIVHRDISPGNVLLSWRGDVKLTDFGIARAAERRHKTEAGTLKGKYGYMSPEQVSSGEVDARSDLFSVGILLAEMVMARRLFTSTNDLDILLMVRDARLDRLHKYASEFPVELRVLCVRALQRRPEDRWQSAAQFRDALDEWIRRTSRVTARDLGSLIGGVINAPTADLHGEGVVPEQIDDHNGLSGPMTRMSIAKAEAEAKAARAEFIAGESIPQGITEFEGSSGTISVTEDDVMPEVLEDGTGPREVGEIKEMPVVRLLYQLAKSKSTGMLSLEGRAGVLKEAYIVDGQPQFVNSNVDSERLGNFLLQQNALTPTSAAARGVGDAPLRRSARRHARRPRSARSTRGLPAAREAGRGEADGSVQLAEGPVHLGAARAESIQGARAAPRRVSRDRRRRRVDRRSARRGLARDEHACVRDPRARARRRARAVRDRRGAAARLQLARWPHAPRRSRESRALARGETQPVAPDVPARADRFRAADLIYSNGERVACARCWSSSASSLSAMIRCVAIAFVCSFGSARVS